MNEHDPHPLYEMNPLGRFSDRAEDYRRHRPDYPAAAIDAMLRGLGDPARLRAADIGAGTGISARLLADRGVFVFAIEPNAAMRAAAEPHAGVEWREGSAEATGLEAASVRLVLCAQSFHWFRPERALPEFHRILAADGRLALVWNVREAEDPVTSEYTRIIREVSHDHPAEVRAFDSQALPESRWFSPARIESVPHSQSLDLEGLIGRATSSSYVPRDPASLQRLREQLGAVWSRHRDAGGRVSLRYRTDLFLADPSPRR
ncbi:MAG TPA: class I SAM-dependent methyltransferase [Candidatus Sulfotelmatobacter sp.]|nr:class I SAM-dependent methyltransferase [Candidatus Sulfotelmatobacter sp.]